ncbi:MAG: replicative DNA helicase [Marinilabiliales bacterium]|nr:replicative DNA helicase [Marinilabiliales bacterium]
MAEAPKNFRNKTKPATTIEQLNTYYGKVPPQATEVEEAVLGALMLEKDAFHTVQAILKPESFYKEEHKKIFTAIRELAAKEKPIDLLVVTQALRNKGELEEVGGPLYITQLTSKVASAAHIEFHARIIAQKYIQRELILISSEIQSRSYEDTMELNDLIDFAESSLFRVTEGNITKESQPIKPLLHKAVEQIEHNSKKPDGLSGVPSGFTKLDQITSGWQKTDLIIIAARPAMGKTAFVLTMARNMAAIHKVPVAVFSLEMSSLQLVNRLISAETELGSDKIKSGRLENWEWEVFNRKLKTLEEAPLYIDDTPALSIFEFRAKCRRLKMQYNVGIVVVDYLQLMTAGSDMRGNREQEVSMISRNLKAIAKEIDIPIIALSQLNRSVESRDGKRPQLSDLRESGAIEQDADMVMFIHRPEYYGIQQDQDGNSLKGIAEIIVAKHRNGAVGEFHLAFKSQLARFSNLDPSQEENPVGDLHPTHNRNVYHSKMNTEYSTPEVEKGNDFDKPGFGYADITPF